MGRLADRCDADPLGNRGAAMSDPINFDKTGRPTSVGKPAPAERKDQRVVCGARCTWWDSIDKVGSIGGPGEHKLPCCPHCRGVLFEYENEAQWFAAIDAYEKQDHPGYRAMMEWARGRCFPGPKALAEAYAKGRQ
jgi:hypothetical protein